MKNTFRIIMGLLLVVILVFVLRNNKRAVQFEVDQAKVPIDSIPVRVVSLQENSVSYEIKTVGKVKMADEVYVISQTPGELDKVHVKIGQKVTKGDVIAKVNDFFARQEYDMAQKAYEQFGKDYQRYKELAKLDAITQQQVEQIGLRLEGAETKMNSLKKRLGDYWIKAPLDGVINQLFVSRGNAVGLGTPVCQLIGGSYVSIEAQLNPDEVEHFQVGLRAQASSDFGHGQSYDVILTEIGKKAGKFGGVAAVFMLDEDELKSPEAGSIINLQIQLPEQSKYLLPRKALTNTEGEIGVFVVQKDKRVKFHTLAYTNFDDERVHVLDSAIYNQDVVVEGNFMLDDYDLIKLIQ